MNNRIKELTEELFQRKNTHMEAQERLTKLLQAEYNKIFDDSKALAKAVEDAQNASMYQMNEYGEIETWWRFRNLSDYGDCREYFETWLQENHYMRVDWENECFLNSFGPDEIIIQDDTRHDNGVWQSGKLIIAESEYKNEDGEVDEVKRNALIEAYMERTGYFPGVFRVDSYGNVFPINTQKTKDGAA